MVKQIPSPSSGHSNNDVDGQIHHLQIALDSVLMDVVSLKQENQQMKNEFVNNQQLQTKVFFLEDELSNVNTKNQSQQTKIAFLENELTNFQTENQKQQTKIGYLEYELVNVQNNNSFMGS
jgi:chromosome segregation ATPase